MSAVNHPEHYNQIPNGIECIDIVEWFNFNIGSAIKYLWRADFKENPLEDLEKAAWYIQREIEKRKRANLDKDQGGDGNDNVGPVYGGGREFSNRASELG